MTKPYTYISSVLTILCLLTLSSCGGGGGSTGGPPPPPVDFSLAVQPGTVSLVQGASANLSVSASGNAGAVNITISGLPAGVSASPSTFSLSTGTQQNVTLAASASAGFASANLTVSGTAGTISHSVKAALLVNLAQKSPHPPFRTGYIRTDVQWDASFLNFFPQRWIIYHAPTRRFFVTDTFLNRIDVIDANTQQLVGQIPVPGAFVGDETPDHTAIYMGTQVGDLYKIDPVTMKVVQRFPAVQIGPSGFAVFEVRVLADGRLALLGGQGGIPAVDGFSALAIWDPVTNAFFIAPRFGILPGCPLTDHIAEFTLTADRTKVLLGAGVSGGALCLYDPVTDAQVATVTNPLGIGVGEILTPPDGKEIIVGAGDIVEIFDAKGLFETDQFQIGPGGNFFYYSLSLDGNTLYVAPKIAGVNLVAYDWRTHQIKGWSPTMDFIDVGVPLHPEVVDETGLFAAVSAHGISFLEGAALHPGAPTSGASNTFVSPPFGPPAGGTNVNFTFIATPPATSNVFFGNQLGANVALINEGASVTSPPGAPGPVDVTAVLPDGNLVLAPESFSYGPSIVDVLTDSTTAEGGGRGTIFGYGFGNAHFGGLAAAGLQVLINGKAAANLKYTPGPLDAFSIGPAYLFPIESIDFDFPPGTAGTNADIVVSDSAGSATATNAVHYLPPVKTFPRPGSVLVQGIYDPLRDVYYFTDATKIQVFSRTQGTWLAPINMPAGATRLWGISLSPDGSKLAVSDEGAAKIYVLNPDTPAVVSSFGSAALGDSASGEPAGIAVTDAGIVYYMVFYTQFTGPPGLHKLNSTTGVVAAFQSVPALALGNDALTRVLLSSDNARLYVNTAAVFVQVDTATDAMFFNPVIPDFDYEMALASNQTWMHATGWLMDTSLNPESFLTFTDRQGATFNAVFGAKLSPDGSLLFQPLLGGIDVFDGKLGTLRTRVALPVQLSANYDALVADGKDNVLVGIAGLNGDQGVAVIDFSGLPVPPPLPFAATHTTLPAMTIPWDGRAKTASARAGAPGQPMRPFTHVVNDVPGRTGLRQIHGIITR